MSDVCEVDAQHCCEDEYYEEFFDEEDVAFPFEPWPLMPYPPMLYTRWRLPKHLEEGHRTGDPTMKQATWLFRTKRPRLHVSSLPAVCRVARNMARRLAARQNVLFARRPFRDRHIVVPSRRCVKINL